MGHIFVSYNHKDAGYANKLAAALRDKGFSVWIDDVIEYGSEWPAEIQEHLDSCDLLIVIMTAASYQSKWVQNELNRAMRKNKPIFPLLLEGNEPWLSVEAIQYTDVRSGMLPPDRFYKLLETFVSPENVDSPTPTSKESLNTSKWIPAIVLTVVILTVAAGIMSLGRFVPSDTPQPTATIQQVDTPSVIVTNTNIPMATVNLSTPTLMESISEFVSSKDKMTSILIPAGAFIMGSNNGYADEQPMHQVALNDYWIDKTEITNYMYGLCVQSGQCAPPSNTKYFSENEYADYPVVFVTWSSADTYCSWAGRRLPTEAEWEKAARGTDGRTYPWGNNFDCRFGNFDDENQFDADMVKGGPNCDGFVDVAPVGSFLNGISPYGVLDMAGNVWEWINDWYGKSYYRQSPTNNPAGPTSGDERVIRGGSWNFVEVVMRTTNRLKERPETSYSYIGFRCATSIAP